MADIFVERLFDSPIGEAAARAQEADAYLGPHTVPWEDGYLAMDGRRMLCRFGVPGPAALRRDMQKARTDTRVLWPGRTYRTRTESAVNVVAEQRFASALSAGEIRDIGEVCAGCSATHRVHIVRTLVSPDRTRVLCLYRAPDAESVRLVYHQAKVPVDTIWACRYVIPIGAAPRRRTDQV